MQLLLQTPILPDGDGTRQDWQRWAIGNLITLGTGGPYCHAEIRFRDGRSFSAQAPEGVRFVDSDAVSMMLRRQRAFWSIVDLPKSWQETPELLRWCESELGCAYDYLGAINSGIGLAWHHAQKWFCSEICGEVLSRASGLSIPGLLSPNDLHLWIEGVLRGETYEELKSILPDPPCEAKRAYAKLFHAGGCPCVD